MAMPNLRLVRQVLRERLLTVAGLPDPDDGLFDAEQRGFKPPDPVPGTLWIRETMQKGAENKIATSTARAWGRMRYDVMAVKGAGTEAAETLALAIKEKFEHGLSLNSQGIIVTIDRTEELQGHPFEDAWWAFPVSILYRTHSLTAVA